MYRFPFPNLIFERWLCFTSTPAVGSVAAILADVGSIVTSSVSWIGSFVGAITSNGLLEMFVIVSFVGLGVGLIKRLVRV